MKRPRLTALATICAASMSSRRPTPCLSGSASRRSGGHPTLDQRHYACAEAASCRSAPNRTANAAATPHDRHRDHAARARRSSGSPIRQLAGRRGVVMGYAVRHPGRRPPVRHRVRVRQRGARRDVRPVGRPILEVLREAGVDRDEVTAVANCHLHADHAGQNGAFPARADPRPVGRVGARAHDRPHGARVDRRTRRDVPARRWRPRDHARRSASIATPGHTAGHQSLVVDTDAGRSSLPARPATPPGSGSAIRTRSRAVAVRRTRPPTTARSSDCARSSRSACSSDTTAPSGPADPA